MNLASPLIDLSQMIEISSWFDLAVYPNNIRGPHFDPPVILLPFAIFLLPSLHFPTAPRAIHLGVVFCRLESFCDLPFHIVTDEAFMAVLEHLSTSHIW